MCSSRQLSTSNWMKEKQNRQEEICLKKVCKYDFEQAAFNNVSSSVQYIIKTARLPTSCLEYVMKRQRNISSDITGGLKTMISGKYITTGKRVFFENLPTEDVLKWIDSEPKIIASAIEKLELSKCRAIYGTQPI
ncbi:hypothetical protein GJ496_011086 [Pomphorhynchus laevis]|nr:hypothetical protein GJ496_005104 [Pomphorhynchus laevis]KAI0987869.1 hypothetical protein GJ496_011086 [Pomphorhynchus laevis]